MIVYVECSPGNVEKYLSDDMVVFTEDRFNECADIGQIWTKCELKPISVIKIVRQYVTSKEERIL